MVKPGCSREILKAAISSMVSVTDVLTVMSHPLNAELPLYHFKWARASVCLRLGYFLFVECFCSSRRFCFMGCRYFVWVRSVGLMPINTETVLDPEQNCSCLLDWKMPVSDLGRLQFKVQNPSDPVKLVAVFQFLRVSIYAWWALSGRIYAMWESS